MSANTAMSTNQVAKRLKLKPPTLRAAVNDGRVPAPAKGPGGCFWWSPQDLQRAAAAFDRRHLLAKSEASG